MLVAYHENFITRLAILDPCLTFLLSYFMIFNMHMCLAIFGVTSCIVTIDII